MQDESATGRSKPDDAIADRRLSGEGEAPGRRLERAASPDASPAEAARIDAEVTRNLLGSGDPDAELARIAPGDLARLLERSTARIDRADGDKARGLVWQVLDLVRSPEVLRRIERAEIPAWSARILAAVDASHLTVGRLFRQRAERYDARPLFQLQRDRGTRPIRWRQAVGRTERLARGLIALDEDGEPAPVALLSENRLDMALIDLACLTGGMVDIMIPANSTEADVGYMLRHAHVRTVVVSDARQLDKVLRNRESLPDLRHIVAMDPPSRRPEGVIALEEMATRFERVPAEVPIERSEAARIDDLATVMYTSGTTGMPKGIRFSHRNLVFKRFARALALPEIGPEDTFLCYLPLFHTFGRYLEMLGCIFWGATYCFLENPSLEALVRGMQLFRPTMFVSIPKRWMQLHEVITRKADPLRASDDELLSATQQITGGRLRWGLSAAGHLESEIFRFFQRQGVELCSGFGMTEATGGITMTPPGEYRDESLGVPLPGVEVRLADDGEMLIRGPYVTIGYLDPPEGERGLDEDGWLATGDLMERDTEGHYRLVDRKKEIYKNIKGETIAPQRVENLFRDFHSLKRVFLVGDHREYNIVLIVPDYEFEELDLRSLSPQELRDHYRSLIVSVNKFLAPYERVVDFEIIDRDLDLEHGELTPKGTPRRQVVVRNFAEVIRSRYRRTVMHVGDAEITLPNWLFQQLGLTAQDIEIGQDRIVLPWTGSSLTVRRAGEQRTQVGSSVYRHRPGPLNLGAVMTSPRLWLGNEELVQFVPLEPSARHRPGRTEAHLAWDGRVAPFRPAGPERVALLSSLQRTEHDLMDLDRAARFLSAEQERWALEAVALLERIVTGADERLAEPARSVLDRAARSSSLAVRRRVFRVLMQVEKESRFPVMLRSFLEGQPHVLDAATREAVAAIRLTGPKVDALIDLADRVCSVESGDEDADRLAFNLLRLLAAFGATHPTSYRRIRSFLVAMTVFGRHSGICAMASEASLALQKSFRAWLRPASDIAVDPETGEEYHWADVVVLDDEIPEEDRRRLLSAIRTTALLREAVFLFSHGVLMRLSDVPPAGVWVRPLGARHGKSVYRVTVHTRYQGAYDLAVNVNQSMTDEQVREEIDLLIMMGGRPRCEPLVEEFGGYWESQDLWSEEFISGDTLDRAMTRLARRPDEHERLLQSWPFLAWTALSGYVEFWNRTGRLLEIADPSMSGVVVPPNDYHTGVRLVSVSARRQHEGLVRMMQSFMDEFIRPAERSYPALREEVGWDVVFSSVLEVVGEDQGLELCDRILAGPVDAGEDELRTALRRYADTVRVRGFLPRTLFFAAKRYRRWARLSRDATREARARTLQELWDTYGLQRLVADYPEARVRFFRETVFRGCPRQLSEGLEILIAQIRSGDTLPDELVDRIAALRSQLELGPDEDYFLARLSFPHLRPEDSADFVSSRLGGKRQSELVVRLEDHEGGAFRVRHALNPKEVGRLYRLFLASKLYVTFRPEHQYLVAINDREQLIGGIHYEVEEDGHAAHLEKIVVSEHYRRKGVADGLMNELFNRLRAAGVKTVTTGFFRPEYFYAYGFKIEKRYAGLVKSLEPQEEPAEAANPERPGSEHRPNAV